MSAITETVLYVANSLEQIGPEEGSRMLNISGVAAFGALYGGIVNVWQTVKHEKPVRVGTFMSGAVGEAAQWGGAMFMTDMMTHHQFPKDMDILGNFITVLLWFEALLPKLY